MITLKNKRTKSYIEAVFNKQLYIKFTRYPHSRCFTECLSIFVQVFYISSDLDVSKGYTVKKKIERKETKQALKWCTTDRRPVLELNPIFTALFFHLYILITIYSTPHHSCN